MLPCSLNIFGCFLGPKIIPVAPFTVRARNMGLNKVPYEKVLDSLAQSSPATKVGLAWSFLQKHKNHKENQTSVPSRRITYFIFGIPVTAFSHATTARAQYKWRTVVKDREIFTCVQQPHVSIWIYLKGRFCYQRGIESTRQHMWKGYLSHKNTLYAHKGQ